MLKKTGKSESWSKSTPGGGGGWGAVHGLVTGFRVVTGELPATFTRTRYRVPHVSPPMVTSVCVVEIMIGAAPAAPTASATTTATRPRLSEVDLRNAGGVPLDGGFRSRQRLPAEVVGRSPDSSGGAAPQIESPQNRHLDLLVVGSQLSCTPEYLSKVGNLQRKQQ
jgi:hypothetical protein